MAGLPYGVYLVGFKAVAITAVQDLFEITAPSDAVTVIDELFWQQYAPGATNEFLTMALQRYGGAPTSGSGGTAPTPQQLFGGGGSAGSTAEVNNTTQITGGSLKWEKAFGLNAQRLEWKDVPQPPDVQVLSPTVVFVWSMDTTPTTGLTVNAHVKISEFGG
jgi:hypothetical protein